MQITEAKDQLLSCFWSGRLLSLFQNAHLIQPLQNFTHSKLFEGQAHNVAFWAKQMSRTAFKLRGALADTFCVAGGFHPWKKGNK